MIWNLDINFGQIEDISSSASEYASSMKELKSALNKFLAEVKTNEGQAVQALQEKPQELTEALDKNAEGLELISNLLKEFDSAMTGIIAPVSQGSNLQINTVQVKNKLKVALIVLAVVALITLFFVFAIKIFIFFLPVILIFGLLRLIFR
jgi:uncharacterized protein YukE